VPVTREIRMGDQDHAALEGVSASRRMLHPLALTQIVKHVGGAARVFYRLDVEDFNAIKRGNIV
jgi:hypothetical protein